jgi:hypothetical protein
VLGGASAAVQVLNARDDGLGARILDLAPIIVLTLADAAEDAVVGFWFWFVGLECRVGTGIVIFVGDAEDINPSEAGGWITSYLLNF